MAETEHKGTLYCQPALRGKAKTSKTSPQYCKDCGFKIRGKNHENGDHHKGIKIKQIGKSGGGRRR